MEDCTNISYERMSKARIDLLFVVQEVVCEVIANVAKNPPTKHRCCGVPVVEEDCVGKLVEWGCESNEQSRWHD